MSKKNKNVEYELFSKENEDEIKRSIKKFERHLGITETTPDFLKQSFAHKLAASRNPKKTLSAKWRGLVMYVVTAFSFGILIGRLLMAPATLTIATRGIEDAEAESRVTSTYQNLYFQVLNPKVFSFEVISAALDAGMEVEVIKAGEKYGLYIKPFKANTKTQSAVKSLLGVEQEYSGAVNATVGRGSD
jgi:hypothetical protein